MRKKLLMWREGTKRTPSNQLRWVPAKHAPAPPLHGLHGLHRRAESRGVRKGGGERSLSVRRPLHLHRGGNPLVVGQRQVSSATTLRGSSR